MDSKSSQKVIGRGPGIGVMLCLLLGILGFLFLKSFLPGYTVFSNDGPLGVENSASHKVPDTFFGGWQDLNSIGVREGALPDITYCLLWLLGPLGFSKFYAPAAIFILGMGAWTFFRRLGFAPIVCVIGALAAALNSTFFSTACWGVAAHPIAVGMFFFALAGLSDRPGSTPPAPGDTRGKLKYWIRIALSGMAVGMGVAEGADVGVLFSMLVAAWVVYQAFTTEGPRTQNVMTWFGRLAVVVLFAGFLAAGAVYVYVAALKGSTGGQSAADKGTSGESWDFATQWSLPKREILGLVVPGLFGYRMDTPKQLPDYLAEYYQGGSYWGAVGRDPAWDRYFAAADGGALRPRTVIKLAFNGAPNLDTTQFIRPDGKISLPVVGDVQAAGMTIEELEKSLTSALGSKAPVSGVTVTLQPPQGFIRFGGGGFYAGLPVVLIGLWAVFQSLRRKESVFGMVGRRAVWFWIALAIAGVLLSFGRFAPFYQLIYPLPFFSSIRNPGKFLNHLNIAMVVLFAYGLDGLWRVYVEGATARAPGLKAWWTKANQFERRWVIGCCAALGASLIAWLIYASSKQALEQYLRKVQIDENLAPAIASFSITQPAWYLLFFILSLGLMLLFLSGSFSGQRAKMGGILLGGLLLVDLGRANLPWILYWDYTEKYASNPVLDRLRDKPYEHRVALLSLFNAPYLDYLYKIEWAQHQFQYYNIQSLDLVQMPRMPEDLKNFEATLQPHSMGELSKLATRWQLTNTRYLLGPTGALGELNQRLDPARQRFRILQQFELAPKAGYTSLDPSRPDRWTALPTPNGQYALFEFDGALPRAKLYSNWEFATNDQAVLNQLTAPTFDPEKSVFVAGALGVPPSAAATNASAGNVSFTSYDPKKIDLKADATSPSVLLLNDRFDPDWHVFVDGKQTSLLRCNYIMRGVFLPVGTHTVEFRFEPPVRALYITGAAMITGLLMCGFLFALRERPISPPPTTSTPAKPKPAQQAVAKAK